MAIKAWEAIENGARLYRGWYIYRDTRAGWNARIAGNETFSENSFREICDRIDRLVALTSPHEMTPQEEENRDLFAALDTVVAALVLAHPHAPEDRCLTCDAIEEGESTIRRYAQAYQSKMSRGNG